MRRRGRLPAFLPNCARTTYLLILAISPVGHLPVVHIGYKGQRHCYCDYRQSYYYPSGKPKLIIIHFLSLLPTRCNGAGRPTVQTVPVFHIGHLCPVKGRFIRGLPPHPRDAYVSYGRIPGRFVLPPSARDLLSIHDCFTSRASTYSA